MNDVHTTLITSLENWIKHYTNEETLNQILDKNLPVNSISDQEMIKDKDIQSAIKLLRLIK